MPVVLYEGVVATPRILDLRGRRSVPGTAITLPVPLLPNYANAFIAHDGVVTALALSKQSKWSAQVPERLVQINPE